MTNSREWTIQDGKIPEAIINYIKNQKGRHILKFEKSEKKRSLRQNAALHLWFQQLSDTFNQDGIDMRAFLKANVDIYWTPYGVKEYIWKVVQKQAFGDDSTTKLTTDKINKIVDFINKHIGEKYGIFIPWPSEEELNK